MAFPIPIEEAGLSNKNQMTPRSPFLNFSLLRTSPSLLASSPSLSYSPWVSGQPGYFNMTTPLDDLSSRPPGEVPLQWGMLGLTLIVVCTAAGNVLVCLAVCWERRLQNMTNYFLMSLAIADLLVSLLVMPLGMVVEMFGYFPMSQEVCVLWVASDVLMCTASIWHMCTMSMDRYFTLKYPMRYGRNKTRRMVAGKILFVWVVSLAISSPVCIHGFLDPRSVFLQGDCVPTVANFVIYGSIFAFYVPLLIMIVTYVLTIRILWKNQLRMRIIDRSNFQARLGHIPAASSTASFVMPKLFSGRKRPTKFGSSLASASRIKGDKGMFALSSAARALSFQSAGNVNSVACELDLTEEGSTERKEYSPGVTYLTLPSPDTLFSRSPTPNSAQRTLCSDTEESESDVHYVSLVQNNTLNRSLISCSQSLHHKLQKRQIHQQQQQQQEQGLQHHQFHCYHQNQVQLPVRLETNGNLTPTICHVQCKRHINGTSVINIPSSEPLSLVSKITGSPRIKQKLLPSGDKLGAVPPKLASSKQITNIGNKESELSKHAQKKKRFSKRCKKKRNSLTSKDGQVNQLAVPGYVLPSQPAVTNKLALRHTSLVSAVSDSQVCRAGLGQAPNEEHSRMLVSGHLNKDYKSMEWDRRYFQIQEEMDRCLLGDFDRTEEHQHQHQTPPRPQSEASQHTYLQHKDNSRDLDLVSLTHKQTNHKRPALQLDSPVFLDDPLNVRNICSASGEYCHSAPTSPLNRRPVDISKLSSSDEDRPAYLGNDNESDKNEEDYVDTSVSSNSDVIAIRLHPPTPKSSNASPASHGSSRRALDISSSRGDISHSPRTHNPDTSNCFFPDTPEDARISRSRDIRSGTTVKLTHDLIVSDQLIETPCCCKDVRETNQSAGNNLGNPVHKVGSLQSLSPVTSSIPELIISSEGEMTLEETDDTLDDNPRIQLRRPRQLNLPKNKPDKKFHPNGHLSTAKNLKSKQGSFKNTFRIHRGKKRVKHLLSKKTATNEKKASKVLGIIFLVFVVLWTPFFVVNILNATCASCMDSVSREVMSLFLWMGYVASLANPIIYTMFNTAFRRTFIRILTCQIQRTFRLRSGDTKQMSYTSMLTNERRNTVTVVLKDESR